jgi:hypothetical protein
MITVAMYNQMIGFGIFMIVLWYITLIAWIVAEDKKDKAHKFIVYEQHLSQEFDDWLIQRKMTKAKL